MVVSAPLSLPVNGLIPEVLKLHLDKSKQTAEVLDFDMASRSGRNFIYD